MCSKLFFVYPRKIIRLATENQFTLTDEMVINMNTETIQNGEDESYIEVKQFWAQIERQVEIQKGKGVKEKEIDWNSVLMWALIRHMTPQLMFFISLAITAETLAIFYSYFIGNMIEYLQSKGKDEDM